MTRRRWAASLATALALVIGGGVPALASPPAQAPAPARHDRQVTGATTLAPPDAVGEKKKTAKQRDPLTSPTRNAPEKLLAAPRAAACSVSDFTGNTGTALVNAVKAASVECVNSLFSITGSSQYGAFREAQMVTVANALKSNAASYNGTNAASTEQLVLFLRAGYYVQYYNPETVGQYTATLARATEGALDAFYANSASSTVSDANGEILGEAVILIDSAGANARYLYVVKRLLNAYNNSYNSSWNMRNAVNNVFTVLFRGQWATGYPEAVQADPSIVDTVHSFARNHMDLLGGDSAFLDVNAGGELSRFVQYAPLQSKVRPLIKDLLDNSAITGARAALWVRVADVANAYDEANCSSYGTCDLSNRVKSAVLTQNHTCSANVLRINSQAMTADDFTSACTSMLNQNSYFHSMMQSGGKPVADDYNSNMEVVVFRSPQDYQTYAGVIFGIDTNNGGMYLEGDPSVNGNQPRFIAYQRSDDSSYAARIWNLNHEYAHYLDGRYNQYGDFGQSVSKPDIWWIEGSAEYVSYSYRNLVYKEALAEAPKHTYALSTLFDTTYENSNTNRTYRWGYLAVRFMMERHRADLTTLLGHYRAGRYDQAYAFTKSLNYDGEFNSWLDTVSGGGTPTVPTCTGSDTRLMGKDCQRANLSASTGNYAYFYVLLPAGTTSLTVTASGGSGDADLYFNPNTWATTGAYTTRSATANSNSETLTINGLKAGTYNYISLHAKSGFSGVTLQTRY